MTTPSAEPGTTAVPSSPMPDNAPRRPDGRRDSDPLGATLALTEVIRILSPVAARRASLRFAVVERCLKSVELEAVVRIEALTCALMSELGFALAGRPTTEATASEQAGQILTAIPSLDSVAETLRHQHENWDGSGEPSQLSGTEIPIGARLVAVGSVVADVISDTDSDVNWSAAAERVRDLRATRLDPDLSDACVDAIGNDAFEPLPTLEAQLDHLTSMQPAERPFDALSSISAAIGAVDDLADVVALIADEARHDVGAAALSVARYQPERGLIRVLVNSGELEPGQLQVPNDEAHPFEIPTGARLKATMLAGPGGQVGDLIAAPVHTERRLWGFVLARAGDLRPPFGSDDLQVLDRVTVELAQAVDKVERLAEVVDMALRDPLTGLGNRRVLNQRLAVLFEGPLDQRADCALVMCDLDRLKAINDTMGHAVGDQVLIDVAGTLRTAVATFPATEVCRIGGDEFCVLVEHGGREDAELIGARINELIARHVDPPISVSCGIAAASSTTRSPSDLLRAADEAQYAVKRARRGAEADIASGGGRRSRRGG